MKSLIVVSLLFVSLTAAAKTITNDDVTKYSNTTDTVAKLQCGNRILITNILPYPEGCVVIDKVVPASPEKK